MNKDTTTLYNTPQYRAPHASHGRILVTPVGKPTRPTHVYIFADLLEELIYSAGMRAERGILTGTLFRVPSDMLLSTSGTSPKNGKSEDKKNESHSREEKKKDESHPDGHDAHEPGSDKHDYIEVTAFKDIFPTDNALDYAGYLRRLRDFRNPDDNSVNLGCAIMSPENNQIMLEDLLLQRSYFAELWQIALFVEAGRKAPRVYMLDDESENFIETGYFIIGMRDTPLPFDLPSDG